ncbi:MAG: LacI family transcriptional regulator [Bifidobacterium sp.]|nr:LacI family transcriptional regulator [Bifidobacterium sp.]MCI1864942.1 LacI family transcriptional regulator [Bifidobacterium sp.]
MKRRTTIKDVAREADVSIKTVSNVVNHSGSMRPETRERVTTVMKKLGYNVNVSARTLKTGFSNIIGLGIFDFGQPFAPYFADKVIDIAEQRGYGVIISTYEQNKTGLTRLIERNSQLPAGGWIYFNEQPLSNHGLLLDQSYPLVATGDYLVYDKVDSVTMENSEPFRLLTHRLIDSGCSSIAVLGSPLEDFTGEQLRTVSEGSVWLRMKGYYQACEEIGKPIDPSLFIPCKKWREKDGTEALRSFLAAHDYPDAIMCMNDALALAAIHELQRKGLRVPQDIQVTGFDNVPESRYCTPTLTTIDPDMDHYIQSAVDMLIERMNGYDGPVRRVVSHCSIVERDSAQFIYHRMSD